MLKFSAKIEALLFDASGVLIDDSFATWRAFNQYFSLYGQTLSLQSFKQEFCLPCQTFLAKMGLPKKVTKEFTKNFYPLYLNALSYVKLFPEVKETLKTLKQRGVKLGLVSATPKELLLATLRKFRLKECFETIICDAKKPSAQPIRQACEDIGVYSVERVAYVGDMEEDIISAKLAGVISVGLCRPEGSYHDSSRLQAQNPKYILRDLRELSGLHT